MANWIQNLIVILTVGACAVYLGRHAYNAMAGRRSKLGSCCDKGCGSEQPAKKSQGEKVAFIPLEMLSRRK